MKTSQLIGTLSLLFTSATAGQTVEYDIAYGDDPLQRLDLSFPSQSGFNTIVFIHGGSLTSGDKGDEDYRGVCSPFVQSGMACANINYRLAPTGRWPTQAQDVASAVMWVRSNIAARGGDPGKIVLLGHSSGATLAALLGTDQRYLEGQSGELKNLCAVVAMGSIMWDDDLEQTIAERGISQVQERFRQHPDYAMYQSLEQYRDRWPIRHLKAGLPPILFLIAESEREQPPVLRTNREFVERSRAMGNRAEYLVLKDRTHYSAVRRLGEPGDTGLAAIIAFLEASHCR